MKRGIIFLVILLILSSLNVLAAVQPEDCYAKCRSSIVLEIPRDGESCSMHGGIGGWDPFILADCDPGYYDTRIQTRTCGSENGITGCYDCFLADGQPNPDLEELCDGVDNNCNGLVDEGKDCDKCPPAAENGLIFPSESSSGMTADFYKEALDQINNQNQQSLSDSDRSYAENFADYFFDEFKHNLLNPSDMLQTSFEHSEALGWTVGGLYYGGMALAAPAVAEVAAFYAPSLYYNPTVAAAGTAAAGFIKGMYDPVIGGVPPGNAGRMLRSGPSRGVRGREFGGVYIGKGGIIRRCLDKFKRGKGKTGEGSMKKLNEVNSKTPLWNLGNFMSELGRSKLRDLKWYDVSTEGGRRAVDKIIVKYLVEGEAGAPSGNLVYLNKYLPDTHIVLLENFPRIPEVTSFGGKVKVTSYMGLFPNSGIYPIEVGISEGAGILIYRYPIAVSL